MEVLTEMLTEVPTAALTGLLTEVLTEVLAEVLTEVPTEVPMVALTEVLMVVLTEVLALLKVSSKVKWLCELAHPDLMPVVLMASLELRHQQWLACPELRQRAVDYGQVHTQSCVGQAC